jgi:hypothetical protein
MFFNMWLILGRKMSHPIAHPMDVEELAPSVLVRQHDAVWLNNVLGSLFRPSFHCAHFVYGTIAFTFMASTNIISILAFWLLTLLLF